MRLNLRLVAVIFGLVVLAVFGADFYRWKAASDLVVGVATVREVRGGVRLHWTHPDGHEWPWNHDGEKSSRVLFLASVNI